MLIPARHYEHAKRIPWGLTRRAGEVVGIKEGGVLDLAARWVRSYAAEAGNYPGVRSCHYALIALCAEAGLVYRNTLDAYTTLSRYTASLRRLGMFPSFEDSTRSIDVPLSFASTLDRIRSATNTMWLDRTDGLSFASTLDRIRSATNTMWLDRTDGQEWQTYVVVEKRGMRGRVVNWTRELGIAVVPLGGFSSETIEREVRERIEGDGRPARGLFVSDFDPSGLLLPITFQRHVPFDEIVRVALTAEQIDALNLPTDPAPEDDSRLQWFIEETGRSIQVESDALDALHPGVLKDALMDAINERWDEEAHGDVLEREQEARWQMACATEFITTNTEKAA